MSTYNDLDSALWVSRGFLSKCVSNVLLRINGEQVTPNDTTLNLNVEIPASGFVKSAN